MMMISAEISREVMIMGMSLILPPLLIVALVSAGIWALKMHREKQNRQNITAHEQKLQEILNITQKEDSNDNDF